jgi:MoaA/NifB/PqqE/SkfB family radical SAM enzyme
MGIHHNMVMAYDQSATYSTERNIDVAPKEVGQFFTFGEFTEQHLEELMAEVEKDLVHMPLAERVSKRYYLRGIRNRLLGRGGRPNPKCVALNSHMRLYPNGDVPVCQFNSKPVGNLRRQRFDELWQGEEITAQRDWVAKCPGCWAECEVLPSEIYTGDLLRETLFPGKSALE